MSERCLTRINQSGGGGQRHDGGFSPLGTALPRNLREQDRQAIVRTVNLDGTDVLGNGAVADFWLGCWGKRPYSLVSEQIRNSLVLWARRQCWLSTIALALGLRELARSLQSGQF
jgi:hypothetical protein